MVLRWTPIPMPQLAMMHLGPSSRLGRRMQLIQWLQELCRLMLMPLENLQSLPEAGGGPGKAPDLDAVHTGCSLQC